MTGTTIAHYDVLEKLGEGGMGVVYRARDTKLNRDVAIKVLPNTLTHDRDRMERFRREAQLLAQLNHPAIAGIHGIEESNGQYALVMELAEGPTLGDRLAIGPIPIDEALAIAKQVAEALEAAHEKGIIHRDLKPPNIKISEDGQVKVLDFGLAKALEGDPGTSTDVENSPTLTMAATQAGVIMGTAAYMSPEQARGKTADKRADIWSFGVVLYEMLTGQQMFGGETVSDSLAGVLKTEIELKALPDETPRQIRKLLSRCLDRNRKQRLHDIADARLEIEEALSGPEKQIPEQVAAALPKRSWLWPAVAALSAFAFLALAFVHFSESPPQQPVRRFSFSPEGLGAASISPDGLHVVFTAQTGGESSLWLRALDSETAREIPGTEGARQTTEGWSPDSQSIVFATTTQIKRVAIDGGNPVTLGALPNTGPVGLWGVSWSRDGEQIVFSSGRTLWEIPARGGEPRVLVEPESDPGSALWAPHLLLTGAGPEALVCNTGTLADPRIGVMNLETGDRRDLVAGLWPVYSPDGYLIHQAAGQDETGLRALPFSLTTLEVTGEAFPISAGGVRPSVSRDGSLAYLDRAPTAAGMRTLVWRSRTGEALETVGQPQPELREFALSPDRRRVATTVGQPADIWIQDLNRSTTTRLTFDARGEFIPIWSPFGREVVYTLGAGGGGTNRLMRMAADGTGEPVVLVEAGTRAALSPDWSRDGRYMVYQMGAGSTPTGEDIHYVRFETDGSASEPVTFLSTPAAETVPKLSPDGRLVVYVSNESGRREVYVRPFPNGDGRWQASVSGGAQPLWRSDGKELYYVEDRRVLMAVPVGTGQGLELGQPQRLFESGDLSFRGLPWPQYDVSTDGQRFLTSTPVEDENAAPPSIHIVENWYEEFRDRQ